MGQLVYHFGDLAVELSADALSTMLSHRQHGFFSKEAGGQMFATRSLNFWRIEAVTGPRSKDRRGHSFFHPDRTAEQEEIYRFYDRGLEFVGDWHTHPEKIPRPSRDDMKSVGNVVRESVHDLPGVIMCIVGQKDPPDGVWLSLHRRDGSMLEPKDLNEMPTHSGRPRRVVWI